MIVLHRLGSVYLMLGRTDDALRQVEYGLKMSHFHDKTRPRVAQDQRDLSIFYDQYGDALQALERIEDARVKFEESLRIRRSLAENDLQDFETRRDLSISYERVGEVLLQLGRTDEALRYLEECLKSNRDLVSADPQNAQKQQELCTSYSNLGQANIRMGQYDIAKAWFQRAITVLDEMIKSKLNVEFASKEKAYLETAIQFCQNAVIATGDWEMLLKSDSKVLPELLGLRATQMARHGQLADVAPAAEKLRRLEPGNKGNLYNAACAYALCVRRLTKDKPNLTEAEQAERKKYVELSMTCLKEAIACGYDDPDHMKQDTDLNSLRSLPEFDALLKMLSAK